MLDMTSMFMHDCYNFLPLGEDVAMFWSYGCRHQHQRTNLLLFEHFKLDIDHQAFSYIESNKLGPPFLKIIRIKFTNVL